jgi:type VI secretion system secreted protein VgrG
VNIQGKHELEGPGGFFHFGDHVKTTDEATRKAKIRAEMFAVGRETFKGTGIFRSARPGYRFKLSEAKAEGLDGEYLITRVTHVGGFDAATGETADATDGPVAHYRCAFEAIPAKTVFRPLLLTPKPRANGILTALIDGQKDKYAYIDDEGRYKVKLFFDPSPEADGKASKAIRLAQPYAGPGYGMHFPLHTGTEIAIGFVDGDLDRPIGLGAVPNPGKGSPVKSGNKSSNVMKSHTGNSVTLEDKEGKTGIFMASTGGHTASLNDDGGSKGITLNTSGSNSLALDDTNKKMVITTAGGHSITIDDNAKTISVSSSGGNTVVVDDNGNKITLTAAGTCVAMDGGGGKINIDASSDITITAGGNLTMDVTGDFTLNAKNVNLNATAEMKADAKGTTISGGPSISMDAASVKVSGKADVALDAPKIDVAAKAAASISGAKVDLAAQGICTIAGATVKIN